MEEVERVWSRFRAADSAHRSEMLGEMLACIHEHGLTSDELDQLRDVPGLQLLTERKLVNGGIPPANART